MWKQTWNGKSFSTPMSLFKTMLSRSELHFCHLHSQICTSVIFVPLTNPPVVLGNHIWFVNQILLGEEVCSQALGTRRLKLQASRDLMKHLSPKSVLPAFRSGTESFVAIKYSKLASVWFSPSVRLLGGSYKWIVFPRHSLSVTGKEFLS